MHTEASGDGEIFHMIHTYQVYSSCGTVVRAVAVKSPVALSYSSNPHPLRGVRFIFSGLTFYEELLYLCLLSPCGTLLCYINQFLELW